MRGTAIGTVELASLRERVVEAAKKNGFLPNRADFDRVASAMRITNPHSALLRLGGLKALWTAPGLEGLARRKNERRISDAQLFREARALQKKKGRPLTSGDLIAAYPRKFSLTRQALALRFGPIDNFRTLARLKKPVSTIEVTKKEALRAVLEFTKKRERVPRKTEAELANVRGFKLCSSTYYGLHWNSWEEVLEISGAREWEKNLALEWLRTLKRRNRRVPGQVDIWNARRRKRKGSFSYEYYTKHWGSVGLARIAAGLPARLATGGIPKGLTPEQARLPTSRSRA